MQILMTNHSLRAHGGSESFVADVSTALRRLGHELAVFSVEGGPMAERLAAAGIVVVNDPRDCPFRPDVIHGQHHLETMAALCAWPGTPAIYLAHGAAPWEERPPCHPRIVRYLGTSPRFGPWIADKCGVSAESVGVVPNFFDPRRFVTVRPPIRCPGRALVFHNAIEADGAVFSAISEACQAENWSVEGIGTSFGRTIDSPERVLPDYDLVFAGGRSAIEAMACGCAVVPVTRTTLGTLIRPDNFEAQQEVNFCAETTDPAPSVESVRAILTTVNPEDTALVTRKIREEATLDAAVEHLVEIYQSAVIRHSESPPSPPESELPFVAHYLVDVNRMVKEIIRWRNELVIQKASVRDEKDRAEQRAEKWKRRAEESAARLESIRQKMESGPWWLARLWRKWRREWKN